MPIVHFFLSQKWLLFQAKVLPMEGAHLGLVELSTDPYNAASEEGLRCKLRGELAGLVHHGLQGQDFVAKPLSMSHTLPGHHLLPMLMVSEQAQSMAR